ncbi:hypothetical protein ACS0TY_027185 [Phlomoides rotata]
MADQQDIEEFNQLLAQTPAGRNRHVRIPGWRPQIHRVPKEVRSQNEHVFEPVMVSLGPYHHGKPDLSRAERFKYICLDSCSGGDEQRKAELYKLILKNIAEIKRCYADQDETFATFADDRAVALMMLLDACFILNFMVNCLIWLDPNVSTEQINIDIPDANNNNDNNIKDWVDFLGLASSIQYATRDIILLENQEDNIAPIRPPLTPLVYSPQAFYTNRSVTSLKAKGILFRKSDAQCPTDIKFSTGYIRGHLHISIRLASPLTPVAYSNLIAYEVSPSTRTEHVMLCYANLMKSLIQTAEDVKFCKNRAYW